MKKGKVDKTIKVKPHVRKVGNKKIKVKGYKKKVEMNLLGRGSRTLPTRNLKAVQNFYGHEDTAIHYDDGSIDYSMVPTGAQIIYVATKKSVESLPNEYPELEKTPGVRIIKSVAGYYDRETGDIKPEMPRTEKFKSGHYEPYVHRNPKWQKVSDEDRIKNKKYIGVRKKSNSQTIMSKRTYGIRDIHKEELKRLNPRYDEELRPTVSDGHKWYYYDRPRYYYGPDSDSNYMGWKGEKRAKKGESLPTSKWLGFNESRDEAWRRMHDGKSDGLFYNDDGDVERKKFGQKLSTLSESRVRGKKDRALVEMNPTLVKDMKRIGIPASSWAKNPWSEELANLKGRRDEFDALPPEMGPTYHREKGLNVTIHPGTYIDSRKKKTTKTTKRKAPVKNKSKKSRRG